MARPIYQELPAGKPRGRALAALGRSVLISAALVVLYHVLPMDRANNAVSVAELAGSACAGRRPTTWSKPLRGDQRAAGGAGVQRTAAPRGETTCNG